MLATFDCDGDRGPAEAEGLEYVLLSEVYFLSWFDADELHLEWEILACEWHDEGFFPGEVVVMGGGFAVAFMRVVGESAVDRVLFREERQLGLP